jgi:hypothetical protein
MEISNKAFALLLRVAEGLGAVLADDIIHAADLIRADLATAENDPEGPYLSITELGEVHLRRSR